MSQLRKFIHEYLLLEDAQDKVVKLLKNYLKQPESPEGQTAKKIATKLATDQHLDVERLEQIASEELFGSKMGQEDSDLLDYLSREKDRISKLGKWVALNHHEWMYGKVHRLNDDGTFNIRLYREDGRKSIIDLPADAFDVIHERDVPPQVLAASRGPARARTSAA